MPQMEVKYIRIHPRTKAPNPDRTHHRVARYIVFGVVFTEEHGWYKIRLERGQWEYLAKIRQKQEDPFTPLVFDIATEEQRSLIDRQEARNKLVVEQETVDLTTRDLREEPGYQISEAERAREARIAKADGTYGEESSSEVKDAEPVAASPASTKRRPGRPRKVGATQG